jgi:RimJ/RimL family protein N-acetyltransferase
VSVVALVAWQDLAPALRDAVAALQISAEQVEFAGTMALTIAACESANLDEVAGLAIHVDGDVVGWVVLKRGASAPGWVEAGAVVVSGLRVDQQHQRRGIGAIALIEMARWAGRVWPQSSLLVLRVDDGNAAGIRAYEKAGWIECGERRVGRVGVERTLSLRL